MTPNETLKYYKPAFLDLFNADTLDLDRFLRLVIDVLDPASGYGPSLCKGDGQLLPEGCGQVVTFQTADKDGRAYGFCCPNCGAVYPWAMCKGPKKAPQSVTLKSSGGSTVGNTTSQSESGVFIQDNGTVRMPS